MKSPIVCTNEALLPASESISTSTLGSHSLVNKEQTLHGRRADAEFACSQSVSCLPKGGKGIFPEEGARVNPSVDSLGRYPMDVRSF